MAKTKAKKPAKKKAGKAVEKRKKLNLSEEERQRRSAAMKKKIAEGKAGPSFGQLGGRPRKKRASEVAAQVASEHGQQIADVFLDAMKEENPNSVRMKGAEALLKVEEKEARLQMDEEEHVARMGREDLLDALVGMFSENPMLGEMFRSAAASAPPSPLPADESQVIEAEVVAD